MPRISLSARAFLEGLTRTTPGANHADGGCEFYALLNPAEVCGTHLQVRIDDHGDQRHGDQILYVAAQARRLPLTAAMHLSDDQAGLAALLASGARVARLQPAGAVFPADPDQPYLRICAAGWHVTGWTSLDPVLGPQAVQLRAMAGPLREIVEDPHGALAVTYDQAINRLYERDPSMWLGTASRAARNALTAAGVDGWWWEHADAACCIGNELLATAARDLIGTAPGWSWTGYATLTEPYRAATGDWPHPTTPPNSRPQQSTTAWTYSPVPARPPAPADPR